MNVEPTPGLALITRYQRRLQTNLQRMRENAVDGEHLPFLHDGSFSRVEGYHQRRDGWSGVFYLQPAVLGLWQRLDLSCTEVEEGRLAWTTRVLEGFTKGLEIATTARELSPETIEVDVRFFGPWGRLKAAVYGPILRKTYATLYDEDQVMMTARQDYLDGESSPLRCPHMGASLEGIEPVDGRITCPWHGWTIDAATGRCLERPDLKRVRPR